MKNAKDLANGGGIGIFRGFLLCTGNRKIQTLTKSRSHKGIRDSVYARGNSSLNGFFSHLFSNRHENRFLVRPGTTLLPSSGGVPKRLGGTTSATHSWCHSPPVDVYNQRGSIQGASRKDISGRNAQPLCESLIFPPPGSREAYRCRYDPPGG